MKNNRQLRSLFLLILTSIIWGLSFTSQQVGGEQIGPFTFNSVRSIIGSLFLLPCIRLLDRVAPSENIPKTPKQRKQLWIGGISCGLILTLATNLQQIGILHTSVGKAGFLTACYILIVPILGLFLKKKCGINIWVSVAIAIVGLYMLCMTEKMSINFGDVLELICAFIFSLHILVIDYFSPRVDGVRMSCIQFLVTGIITAIPMFILENPVAAEIVMAWKPLLYAGICSCGIGYTLQIIAQKGINPTLASLTMSLESVFSVLGAWVLIGEKLSVKELLGCLLIFVAIILAQLPVPRWKLLKSAK